MLPFTHGSALGPTAVHTSSMVTSGVMHDLVGCLPSADRQWFAEEARKLRLTRLPSSVPLAPTTEAFADIFAHLDTALAKPMAIAPWPAVSSSTPLIDAVATRLFTVYGAATAAAMEADLARLEGTSAHVVRVHLVDPTAVSAAGAAAALPVTAASAAIAAVQHALLQRHESPQRRTVIVFDDAIDAFCTTSGMYANPVIAWAVRAVLATALVDTDGTAPVRVVFAGVATLTRHDELWSYLVAAAPPCAVAAVGNWSVAAELFKTDVNVTVADMSAVPNQSAFDAVADALIDLHTAHVLANDPDSDDDDVDSTPSPPAAIVVVAPDATFASILRHHVESRYVTEPVRVAVWNGQRQFASSLGAGNTTVAPLIVIATSEALSCHPGRLHSALGSVQIAKIIAVVHVGLSAARPDEAMSLYGIMRHTAAVVGAAAEPTKLLLAPLLHVAPGEVVAVGGLTAPRYAVPSSHRRRADFSDSDDIPVRGAVSSIAEADQRDVVALAEVYLDLALATEALCNAKVGHPVAVAVDLNAIGCDIVAPLPPLQSRINTATVPWSALSVAALKFLALSELMVNTADPRKQNGVNDAAGKCWVLTPLGRCCAVAVQCGVGVAAAKFALACTALRVLTFEQLQDAVVKLVSDRNAHLDIANANATRNAVALMDAVCRQVLCLDPDRWRGPAVAATEARDATALAEVWASYPAVTLAESGLEVATLVGHVLYGVSLFRSRFLLTLVAPRSMRTRLPNPPPSTGVCRGWMPKAPLSETFRSSGASSSQFHLDHANGNGGAAQQQMAHIADADDAVVDAVTPLPKTAGVSTQDSSVPTRMFFGDGNGGLCGLVPDASLGSAAEAYAASMPTPSDASAVLVTVKYVLRAWLSNCAVIAWKERLAPAGGCVHMMPEALVGNPLFRRLVTDAPEGRGAGRWIDAVASAQPVSSARIFDTVTESTGAPTAKRVAELSISGLEDRPANAQQNSSKSTNGNAAAQDPLRGFVGTLPPSDERTFIDGVAQKVMAKGRAEAEPKLLGKPAFAFINPAHAFHAYYLHACHRAEILRLAAAAAAGGD